MSDAFPCLVEPERRHLDQMLAPRRTTHALHAELLPDIFARIPDERETRADLASFLRPRLSWTARRRFAVARIEADVVLGYCLYEFVTPDPSGAAEDHLTCYVADIAVLSERRGQGIAGQFLRAVAEHARRDGYTCLAASIWAGNAASAEAFSKAGFAPQLTTYMRRLEPMDASSGITVAEPGPWTAVPTIPRRGRR